MGFREGLSNLAGKIGFSGEKKPKSHRPDARAPRYEATDEEINTVTEIRGIKERMKDTSLTSGEMATLAARLENLQGLAQKEYIQGK